MKNIAGYVGRTATWTMPKLFGLSYELKAGDDLVATLDFKGPFSNLATGKSQDGSWTFDRKGFFRKVAEARVTGKEEVLAHYRQTSWLGGGVVELSQGRTFPLTHHVWRSDFELTSETGEVLVQFRSQGFFKTATDVEIRHKSLSLPELPWLVLLAWYVAVLRRRDSRQHG